MIQVRNLTKKFGKLIALDNISFDIKEREIFGFLGPNGAGKTVTIKILTTQMLPTAGQLNILGYNPIAKPIEIRKNIGVMPEIQNLYGRMTAYENLLLFAKLFSVSSNRVWELLELFALKEYAHKKVKTFSLGMKQKILFARAIIANPKILFLDEPTNGLDPLSGEFIREMMKKINSGGTTIFLTTHYTEEAEMLCHRVAFIDCGKIVACDTPTNLKKNADKKYIKIIFKNFKETKIAYSDLNRLNEVIKDREISSLEIIEPSLRDVFISLTRKDIK